jgi:AcrR family transcriptional regulator
MVGGGAGSEDISGGRQTVARARVRVVQRLRARRAEIDEAIFARISDQWFDRSGSGDPEYVAGLRAAGGAALDYVLAGVERSGDALEPVPVAVLEQARRAARVGVGLDTVLRRYLAGYGLLEGFVIQEVEHDPLLRQGGALRDLLRTVSALVDRLITAVSRAYGEEVERAGETVLPSGDCSPPPRERTSRSDRTSRRDRILGAMVEVAAERGFEHASVKLVSARAGVSSRTFYEEFKDLQECFEAVLDLSFESAGGLIARAFAREDCWQDGVLGALASLLVFFDSEPLLARVWFVEAMAAGSWALQRRERIVAQLRAMIIEYWTASGDEPPDPVAAAGVMASVLGLIQTHLVTERPGPLIELLGPSLGLVTTLYLDREDIKREVQRGERVTREIRAGDSRWAPLMPSPAPDAEEDTRALPAGLANPGARRARECLLFLAEQGGRGLSPSNSEIASAIGIVHKSHISRLLSYLLEEGLAVKHRDGPGAPNAWRLTADGLKTAQVLAERED